MSELMKKRRISTENSPEKTVHIHVVGPAENMDKAYADLKALGFEDAGESVPWRESFMEYPEENLPGVVLSGLRYREGLTQKQLAEKTGIPQSNISEMERGKRTIGKERAKRLASALDADYRTLL